MATIAETIESAVQYHKQGHLEKAEKLYQKILVSEPQNPVALHSLGLLAYQAGQYESALEMLQKAIAANENAPQFHNTIGIILEALGKFEQAVEAYGKAVLLNPGYIEAYNNMAIAMQSQEKYQQTVEICKQLVRLAPQNAQAYNTMGFSLEKQERYDEAIYSYKQAVKFEPNFAEAYNHLGFVLNIQERYEEAIENYTHALKLDPDYLDACYNLANALLTQARYAEAIDSYQHAITLAPDSTEAYFNLANAQQLHGIYDKAVENYKKALRIEPDHAEAHNNLGVALKELGKFNDAFEHYNKALQIKPDYAEVYNNIGLAFQGQGLCEKAGENYERMLELEPENPEVHWNKSLALLLSGQFTEGWKEYKWRRKADLKLSNYPHNFDVPLWDGGSFKGKTIFIYCEQGLGDAMQFARYLPMVKERGGTVIFETWKLLHGLFKDFECIDELTETSFDKKTEKQFDFHASLLDLPMIFETTAGSIPSKIPYISADPAKSELWQDKLTDGDIKVGIVWAGSPRHINDRKRSCDLRYFIPLSQIDGVQLYSLQKGPAASQLKGLPDTKPVMDLAAQINDFTDTAAVIANLDLVISVDTAVVHLAGAMGKPVWNLLPFSVDWRWMLNRTDSPWYPTVRLFRQKKYAEWNALFAQVTEELRIVTDYKNAWD